MVEEPEELLVESHSLHSGGVDDQFLSQPHGGLHFLSDHVDLLDDFTILVFESEGIFLDLLLLVWFVIEEQLVLVYHINDTLLRLNEELLLHLELSVVILLNSEVVVQKVQLEGFLVVEHVVGKDRHGESVVVVFLQPVSSLFIVVTLDFVHDILGHEHTEVCPKQNPHHFVELFNGFRLDQSNND